MARKRKKMEMPDAETPLSSMIDVVFLLLIYFITTQKPIVEDSYLAVDLPSPNPAPTKQTETPPPMLRIDVHKLQDGSDDYYYVNGLRYHINDLRNYLKTVAQNDKNTTVLINCGPNAKHKKLINLLDMCNELQLIKINLLNDEGVTFVPDSN